MLDEDTFEVQPLSTRFEGMVVLDTLAAAAATQAPMDELAAAIGATPEEWSRITARPEVRQAIELGRAYGRYKIRQRQYIKGTGEEGDSNMLRLLGQEYLQQTGEGQPTSVVIIDAAREALGAQAMLQLDKRERKGKRSRTRKALGEADA